MLRKNIPKLWPKKTDFPLFADSHKGKKGTHPSDLAAVLSGRHNTHLVTLPSMSVAH